MKQKIVLATANQGKVEEMADILSELGFEVIAQTELGIGSPQETGLTFVENAILKARFVAEKSGLPTIADDSGLVVAALNGEPGLYSARYAGEEGNDAKNRQKLLAQLQNIPVSQRQAKFVSCIVFLRYATDPSPIIAEGECYGYITLEERGTNGFGYDSLFFSPDRNCTFAEMDIQEKKKISHRGKALVQLKQKLKGNLY
ncbi:RdgB/HAM1 family non-canonical purine NTP pyrophosphatase [Rodentibacter caecimuris]|uniref:dITP/XTP pyrophosphatase n=1 Tax=Rodentibacter caecimuris TaxID=1796644 RepID=A0ABX3L063_9PAST|nr:non-canonical purine NTP pyrophosphatase, RdgB/HAM1 family [Rodentibacter heylii]